MNYDNYKPLPLPFTSQDRLNLKVQLLKEIDETPLTKAERDAALKGINEKVATVAKERNAAVIKRNREREQQFWIDARQELGYDQMLTKKGVEILEAWAYEEGHSYGLQDVYCYLIEVTEILEYRV